MTKALIRKSAWGGQAGLGKYFPSNKAVIVNSDGGSSDGTMEVVQNSSVEDFNAILLLHRVEPVFKIAFPYSGIPGKGSAFRTIFEIAQTLDAKACAVVDSDLRSITPEWTVGAKVHEGYRPPDS